MLSDRQNSSYAKSTVNSIYIILINIERVSKHSVTIRGLRVVTTCWSWAWSNRTSPSKWVGLGSPLAACSVYGDLTCSVHTVNNLCMFNCQCHFYLCNWGPYVRLAFVSNMLSSWNKDIIIIIITIAYDQFATCIRPVAYDSLRDQEKSHKQNGLWGGLRRSSSMVKSLTLQSMIATVVHISSMALWCFLEQSRRNIAGYLIESHD